MQMNVLALSHENNNVMLSSSISDGPFSQLS
jgi:hypothetical protein